MTIEGILEQRVLVDVSPLECINKIIYKYFKTDPWSIVIDGSALYREFDISEHGSPMMERELITKDPNKIKLFEHLFESKKLLENLEN